MRANVKINQIYREIKNKERKQNACQILNLTLRFIKYLKSKVSKKLVAYVWLH